MHWTHEYRCAGRIDWKGLELSTPSEKPLRRRLGRSATTLTPPRGGITGGSDDRISIHHLPPLPGHHQSPTPAICSAELPSVWIQPAHAGRPIMARMVREKELANGWTKWLRPVMRRYRMGCCDCGLVHDVDFRVEDGQVLFRARRNKRSTAGMRRKSKQETPSG